MNLDKLSQLLTVIANIGVLLGLVILIFEINQNTIATENEAAWSRTAVTAEINSLVIENSAIADRIAASQTWTEEEIVNYFETHPGEAMQIGTLYRTRSTLWQSRFLTQNSDDLRDSLSALIFEFLTDNTMRFVLSRESYFETLHPEYREFLRTIITQVENSVDET